MEKDFPPALAARNPTTILARPALWLAIFAALLAIQIHSSWRPLPDSAGYLSIARNPAHGQGLMRLGQRHIYYAPGYPLAISPAYLFSDHPFLLISVLQWGFATATMLGIYFWARGFGRRLAVVIAGLSVLNAGFLDCYRNFLSDTLFMALLVWTSYLLTLAMEASTTRRAAWLTAAGALLSAYMVTVRQVGVVVPAGFGVALLLAAIARRITWQRMLAQGLPVAIAAAAALAALIWHDRMTKVASTYGYVDQIIDAHTGLAAQLAEGLRLRISETGRLMLPGMWKSYAPRPGQWLNVNIPIYAAITIFVAIGWWRLVRHRRDVLLLAAPFYAAIYIVWSYDQATRFFTPMLPVMWASAAAMLLLWRRPGNRAGRSGTPARHWGERFGKRIFGARPSSRKLAVIVLAAIFAAHAIVWPIYWVSWRQSAAKSQELWPTARKLATIVGERQEPGVFVGDPYPLRLLLSVTTDRNWPVIPIGQNIPTDTRWVIACTKNANIEGFVKVYEGAGGDKTGEVVLLKRNP